eukprot:UN12803
MHFKFYYICDGMTLGHEKHSPKFWSIGLEFSYSKALRSK